MIRFTTATNDTHLHGILDLQRSNLKQYLPDEERAEQGFLTLSHSFEVLKVMNEIEPHIIALDDNKVVAFLLSMTKSSKYDIPLLIPMFDSFEEIVYRGQKLSELNFIVVGQACVAKSHRGIGVFDKAYDYFRLQLQKKYSLAVTEISIKNTRSLNAHLRIGFEPIVDHTAPDGETWSVVIWNWL